MTTTNIPPPPEIRTNMRVLLAFFQLPAIAQPVLTAVIEVGTHFGLASTKKMKPFSLPFQYLRPPLPFPS